VAALCRPGRATVVDEAFMDFVPGQAASLASRRDLPGLVVVRSLTKLWGLAGVRAGYLLAPAEIAARVRRVRPPWSVNAVALAALRACAGHDGEDRARATAAAREDLRAALDVLPGVRTWPSAANFLLVRVPGGERIRTALLQRGVAVRPASTFPGLGPDHLRVTVRAPAANARLVAALAEALACA
jgi:histidinol-phosphate aminotransferase